MRRLLAMLGVGLLIGCASGPPRPVDAPPMPNDLGRWSQPHMIPTAPESRVDLTPLLARRPPSPHERVFAYEPDTEYAVEVAVGNVLRLALEEGEQIRTISDGDRSPMPEGDHTAPWDIKDTASGPKNQPQVLITVTKPGLTNGISIATSKRVYDVGLRSVASSKIRIVRWEYPAEPVTISAAPRLLPDAPQAYHTGYRWEPSDPTPVWNPTQILDTGEKTYIVLPRNLAAMQAPMIRLIGANGPELVNARQYKHVLILDHLFNVAELRYGAGAYAELVKVFRQAGPTIQCPGHDKCPVW
jgi:type IV secretory pathway VirB9-like protein